MPWWWSSCGGGGGDDFNVADDDADDVHDCDGDDGVDAGMVSKVLVKVSKSVPNPDFCLYDGHVVVVVVAMMLMLAMTMLII